MEIYCLNEKNFEIWQTRDKKITKDDKVLLKASPFFSHIFFSYVTLWTTSRVYIQAS